MMIVLAESMLIAFGGGLLGWVAGHGLAALFSPLVEQRTGIQIGFLSSITRVELTLVPGIVILATIAGIVPALAAYRTDVSRHLS